MPLWKLRRVLLALPPALLGWALCCSETHPAHPATASSSSASERTAERALLWRFESASQPQRVFHVLGSVHVGNASFYPLDPAIENAFDSSKALVVEVNTRALSEADLQSLVLFRAALPAGDNISKHLSPELWTKTKEFLSRRGLSTDRMEHFKPWFLGTTIAMLQVAEKGYRAELGIDHYFLNKGDKQVFELESADAQLRLLDAMSFPLQTLLLEDALEGNAQLGGDLEALAVAWREGDARVLERAVLADFRERPALAPLYDALITQRNRAMVRRISELLAKQDGLFVVVGAAHLVGPEGLVESFVRLGYSARQVERCAKGGKCMQLSPM